MFLCTDFADGSSWLAADLSLRCWDSAAHRGMVAYAACMVLVFPVFIPALFAALLRDHSAEASALQKSYVDVPRITKKLPVAAGARLRDLLGPVAPLEKSYLRRVVERSTAWRHLEDEAASSRVTTSGSGSAMVRARGFFFFFFLLALMGSSYILSTSSRVKKMVIPAPVARPAAYASRPSRPTG